MSAKNIKQYREEIVSKLISSKKLIQVLNKKYENNPKEILYRHIYPFLYIGNVPEETNRYVLFDIEAEKYSIADTYDSFSILFVAVSHKDAIQGEGGIVTDLIIEEIEKIFDTNSIEIGIGKIRMVYNRVFDNLQKDFTGRIIKMHVYDFAKKGYHK